MSPSCLKSSDEAGIESRTQVMVAAAVAYPAHMSWCIGDQGAVRAAGGRTIAEFGP